MDGITTYMSSHWLSLLLIVGVIRALFFVYKQKGTY